MRYEDERYVRFYTRDTADWLALSWQSRGLFGLLIRSVDRAGLMSLGRVGLKAVAVMLHAPWIEIEPYLSELIADGCIAVSDGHLIVPNYIEAQEAHASDAARKRASRERARAKIMAADVTPRDQSDAHHVPFSSRGVTDSPSMVTPGHAESQTVTPIRSEPSLAVPSQAEPSAGRARPRTAAREEHKPGQSMIPDPTRAVLDFLATAKAIGRLARLDFAEGCSKYDLALGGRIETADVLFALRRADEDEAATIASGQSGTDPARLASRVTTFVRNTQRGEGRRDAEKARAIASTSPKDARNERGQLMQGHEGLDDLFERM